MPTAGPYSAEKTGVIIIAAPKPGEAAHHAGNDGHGGGNQEGKSQQVRHRSAATLALRAGDPSII